MPFGIQSAPEVFQRKKHELIQGMPHVEVVADGGPRDGGFKLNMENLKLRQSEVSFIGHIAISEGLQADRHLQTRQECKGFWVWYNTSANSFPTWPMSLSL